MSQAYTKDKRLTRLVQFALVAAYAGIGALVVIIGLAVSHGR